MTNPFQLIQLVMNSNNPEQMLMQILGDNPQYRQVYDIVQNKTPEQIKQYAQNLCKTQNIDIKSLAKQFNLPL